MLGLKRGGSRVRVRMEFQIRTFDDCLAQTDCGLIILSEFLQCQKENNRKSLSKYLSQANHTKAKHLKYELFTIKFIIPFLFLIQVLKSC